MCYLPSDTVLDLLNVSYDLFNVQGIRGWIFLRCHHQFLTATHGASLPTPPRHQPHMRAALPLSLSPDDAANLVCQNLGRKGRLFSDQLAVGDELRRWRVAEQQWARLLDERSQLDVVACMADAEEEAEIATKVS